MNKLFLWVTLWLLICGQSFANEIHNYVRSVESKIGFKIAEANLISYYLDLIKIEGLQEFKHERKELSKKLSNIEETGPSYFIKRIDRKIIKNYFHVLAKKLDSLPSYNPGKKIYKKYLDEDKKGNIKTSFFTSLVSRGLDRGLYFYNEEKVEIDFVDGDSFMLVLIHELTHRFDKEARDFRFNLENLYDKVKFYKNDDLSNYYKAQEYGRTWFLQMHYMKNNFYEAVALFNTCEIVDGLIKAGINLDLSKKDLNLYKDVINGKYNCSEFISNLLKIDKLNLFWDNETSQYNAMTGYVKEWFLVHGFDY